MTPENVMDLAHKTLLVTSLVSAPLLLIALITGLVIGNLKKSDRQPPVEKRRASRKKVAAPAASGA